MRRFWVVGGVAVATVVLGWSTGRGVGATVRKERVAAGAELFHAKGCEFCHGAGLAGTERAPDLTAVGKRRTIGYIEQQIRVGGGGMPAFEEILTGDEVSALLDFLGSKRKQGPINPGAVAIPAGKR